MPEVCGSRPGWRTQMGYKRTTQCEQKRMEVVNLEDKGVCRGVDKVTKVYFCYICQVQVQCQASLLHLPSSSSMPSSSLLHLPSSNSSLLHLPSSSSMPSL
ncbi:hypothetical protein HOLleu_45058 [Holothuria leucospilota]|uniref:Uncharacterized protein n=1 Tax=Holothuria leucospilota TaxID=206669 RepID=A0A9Q1BAJ7_HOLLE|nr:hypothetical protein HOLleu_45058 [Holothuria leucospilota]